jgi:PAS domain S-box-containing protein
VISLRGRQTATWLLVCLTMAAAVILDVGMPPRRLVAMLYAIPILIAAHGLPRSGVIVVSASVIALYLVNAWWTETSTRLQMFSVVSLVMVSYLCVGLAMQIDWAVKHAREAENLANLLDALLTSAPVGLAFWDRDLRCAFINETYAALLGLRAEEARGRTPRELLNELGTEVEDDIRWVLQTRSPLAGRELKVAPARADDGGPPLLSGEASRLIAAYYPVRRPDGDLAGVGTSAVRITYRQ